jgi:hypothetical protein
MAKEHQTDKKTGFRKLVIPLTLTVIGLGLVTVAIIAATREIERLLDDENADVENYDVVQGKPYISRV